MQVNEKISSGEASAEMFGNVDAWKTPILAMTADVTQASNEQCIECGMDDYVSKPFEEEQLYSAVARFFKSGWKKRVGYLSDGPNATPLCSSAQQLSISEPHSLGMVVQPVKLRNTLSFPHTGKL